MMINVELRNIPRTVPMVRTAENAAKVHRGRLDSSIFFV